MTRHDSTEQLVLELYVSDLKVSCEFYISYGFTLVREEHNFAELKWDDSLLFLEQVADNPEPPLSPVGNVRIMVDNVDGYWALSKELGARVLKPIEDRYYGLRDFTIAGPDGVGLRFAANL